MATAASSGAASPASEPKNAPIGVRAADTMYTDDRSAMNLLPLRKRFVEQDKA
jgi:hypothetical protein